MRKTRVVIMGAAGRDFHNFNTVYRQDDTVEIVAFTAATQIPGIADRPYPASLAGPLYPNGIPIVAEDTLEALIKEQHVDECVLSYSDLSYQTVMRLGARVNAAGARFTMLAAAPTMVKSTKPIVAILAVRTGCGKSQTTRRVVEILSDAGKKVVAVRHPMPYGDLEAQKVQRFASIEDLAANKCSIEEMEEYEPHINKGCIVYAGVDYEAILREAEKEADVVVWDGGNNDTSFFKPDLTVVVADPFRPGHEIGYYPGEVNFRLADVIVINKVDSADPKNVAIVEQNAREVNPTAIVIKAESVLSVDNPELIRGKRVLVIEDGPTLTHGEMTLGAGVIIAQRLGATLVDPKPHAVGGIAAAYKKYPHVQNLLPALGYGPEQMKDLEDTIAATECDAVVIGTPIDLARFINIKQPTTRVRYDLSEAAREELRAVMLKKGLVAEVAHA